MAADRFVSVDLDMALWVLDNMRHESRPPDAHMVLELTAAMMDGRLHRYTQRAWQARWRCSRTKVRDIADKVADRYLAFAKDQDRSGKRPAKDQWGTTLLQSFPHLSKRQGPAKDQPETGQGPTRARSSLKKERTKKEEEQQAAQATALSPKQAETAQGIACLRTLRDDYLRGQGKKASSWGKAKGTQKRVGRFLSECRARQDELGAEPLACLEALGRWVFGAPAAEFWRRLPSPLEKVLGGKAHDDCDRMARAKEALAWVAGGQPTTPAPKPRRGKPEHWSVQLAREHAEAAERDRTVITPDPRLFGGNA